MLVLAFIMTVLVSVLATLFVARAYYGRKHVAPIGPETEPQTPAPSGELPEKEPAALENTQFAHIAESVHQEKLFLTPRFGRDELVRRFGLTNRQIGAIFLALGAQNTPSGAVVLKIGRKQGRGGQNGPLLPQDFFLPLAPAFGVAGGGVLFRVIAALYTSR